MGEIFTRVREILEIEAAAISKVTGFLDEASTEAAVTTLLNCRGKVVVIGVGKSAIIGRKIAATMTSTGTAAIFLHAADSMHGDLGLVETGDVAIVLSNSGETDEVLNVLPHLKSRQVPVIAIVGNSASTLSRKSDQVLLAAVDKEACPLNLAPTTSTTVALAVGDALAMAVMEKKGITREKFAFNHPAGRLGKRLTLKVEDLMFSDLAAIVLPPDAPFMKILSAITENTLGAVVVSSGSAADGLITDGDIRRAIQDNANARDLKASDIMKKNPICVEAETLAWDALQLMENRPSQISVLPVVKAGRLAGLLRLHDIVKSGL